ncbi:MAG: FG-GAP repeat domain-containing protein [Acidobacteriota bacterium]
MLPTALSLLPLLFAHASLPGEEPLWFSERRARSGIDYVNVSGDLDKRFIVSSLGGGAALFDYDGDGDLDLYLVNGSGLEERTAVPAGPNRLYRNEGNWIFSDVTAQAGVADGGWGVGCAVGDFDNDGLPDLYVTNIGENVLYRNLGDGTFLDVTSRAGVGHPSFAGSSAFFDAEGDGDLDLYVANYVATDLADLPVPGQEPTCLWFGLEVMCGPRGLEAAADVFYLNHGDGTFSEDTEGTGLLVDSNAYGLGVVSGDYDGDGDTDLYVANDAMPNFLFQNDGEGSFRDVGFLSGVAYNAEGATEAGMGVDFGDPNGDGHLDILVTNFSHETNTLYLSSGRGTFTDATSEMSLSTPSLSLLGCPFRGFGQ